MLRAWLCDSDISRPSVRATSWPGHLEDVARGAGPQGTPVPDQLVPPVWSPLGSPNLRCSIQSSHVQVPKGKFQSQSCQPTKRKFPNGSFDTKVAKLNIPSENHQVKDARRQIPICKAGPEGGWASGFWGCPHGCPPEVLVAGVRGSTGRWGGGEGGEGGKKTPPKKILNTIFGTCWDHFGIILMPFWDIFETILKYPRQCGTISGSIFNHFKPMFVEFWRFLAFPKPSHTAFLLFCRPHKNHCHEPEIKGL